MVEYEILRAGLLDIPKGKFHAHPAANWFEAWEALDASLWDAFYASPDAPSGEAWRLMVRENGVSYKSEGVSSYPKQGQQFFESLDCLMPEMEFISPHRLEQMIFRYQMPIMIESIMNGWKSTVRSKRCFSKSGGN